MTDHIDVDAVNEKPNATPVLPGYDPANLKSFAVTQDWLSALHALRLLVPHKVLYT